MPKMSPERQFEHLEHLEHLGVQDGPSGTDFT